MMGNAPGKSDALDGFMRALINADRVVVHARNALGENDSHYIPAPDLLSAMNIRADLAPAPSWQPIETAPKDGVPILAYGYSRHYPDEYFTRIQWWAGGINDWGAHSVSIIPTHWMPLPAPPEAS